MTGLFLLPGQRYSRSMGWGAKGGRKENAPHNVRRAIWERRLALGWAAKGVRWKRWGKAKEKAYPGTRMRSRFLGRGGSNRYCCVKKRPQGVSPTASPAQRVAVGKQEQSGFCSDVSLRYKIDTRYKRERKGKIKKPSPGRRLRPGSAWCG